MTGLYGACVWRSAVRSPPVIRHPPPLASCLSGGIEGCYSWDCSDECINGPSHATDSTWKG